MRKHLPYNRKNFEKIESLPKIYLVACWARWGIMPLPFSGKYIYDEWSKEMVPLVYQCDDHNGEYAEFVLRKITHITTGQIMCWCENEARARHIADALEFESKNSQKMLKRLKKELKQEIDEEGGKK